MGDTPIITLLITDLLSPLGHQKNNENPGSQLGGAGPVLGGSLDP